MPSCAASAPVWRSSAGIAPAHRPMPTAKAKKTAVMTARAAGTSEAEFEALATELQDGGLLPDRPERQVGCERVVLAEQLAVDDHEAAGGTRRPGRPADRQRGDLAAQVVRQFLQRRDARLGRRRA